MDNKDQALTVKTMLGATVLAVSLVLVVAYAAVDINNHSTEFKMLERKVQELSDVVDNALRVDCTQQQ